MATVEDIELKGDQWKQACDVLPPEAVSEAVYPALLLSLDSLFNPTPNQMLLGTLGDARLHPTEPIQVNIHVEHSQFIAEAPEFNEFGFGTSRSEAIRDLQRALVELYFTLEREQDHLGADLATVRDTLTAKLVVKK
jgi:hypothetical protein